jgi:protein SCO1/2
MKTLLLLCALAAPLFAAEAPPAIPDVPVVDQNGRTLRFYTDLVQGKVVAISFIFTSCSTICTPLGAHMAALQPLIKGHDVQLISISVDPANDTPQRLKAWSASFHPAPGWTLVTGTKEDVTRLLKALRAYSGDPSLHSPLLLVGNDSTGQWTRVNGLQALARIAAAIDDVRASKEVRR